MWWRGQSLDTPRRDASGGVWHFRVWHDSAEHRYVQRIFFWDEARRETGVVEFDDDQALHVRRLRQRIAKLVKDATYRRRFHRSLRFPLERYHVEGETGKEARDA
jgi:hypothetical protein